MKDHPLFRHLALSAALALAFHFPLEALAQTPPDQVKITTWGTRTFTLGNFTGTKDLGIVAGMTLGSNNLMGMPSSVEVRDQGGNPLRPRQSRDNQHIARLYQVQAGQVYQGEVRYAPGGPKALYVRVRASQGNFFNYGTVILTDASNYQRSSAQLVYGEVYANSEIPVWAGILGVLFGLSVYGTPITALLWGMRSGSAEYVLTLPPGTPSTITLYYKMTGCTATSDYNGSFTVPVSSLQPGVAYGVDIYGWCGGGGVGNWARAVQRALVPRPLDSGSGYAYTFSDPQVPSYRIQLFGSFAIYGPDDCSGYYTDRYEYNNGIHFKMSGDGCWGTGFGAPGNTGGVRTSLPSLEVRTRPGWETFGATTDDTDGIILPRILGSRKPSNLYASSSTPLSATFTPRAYYNGAFGTATASGTATSGGTTITGTGVYQTFTFADPQLPGGDNVFDTGQTLTFPSASLTFPAYTGTCTLKNKSSSTLTIYELTPPATLTGYVQNGSASYSFPSRTVNANSTVPLGKNGLYYYTGGSGNLYTDLEIQGGGCSFVRQVTYRDPSDNLATSTLNSRFFGLW
ncbi:hypothetical protein [Thermus caliditerrae]|uniref:hypothetical protein n=1 Tax=Thermus caliditerrae TaxID=1330700 RepID=UPI001F437525|nr:hypothetical protein [Thermus caliditerrae]